MIEVEDRLIGRDEVKRLTGHSRYMIDLLESACAFPKRIKVGERRVYWSYAEVLTYVDSLKRNRPGDWSPGSPVQAA